MIVPFVIELPVTQVPGSTGVGVTTFAVVDSFWQELKNINTKTGIARSDADFFIVLYSEKITPMITVYSSEHLL